VRGRQQDVGRLQIAVDDAALVRIVDGVCERRHQLGGLARWLRFALEMVVQAAASDELQRQVGQAVVLAYLVDLYDVGVLEARHRLGLGAKACQRLRTGVGARQDHLEGDDSLEALLSRLVDDAHGAAAQLAQDVVAGNRRPGRSVPGRFLRILDCRPTGLRVGKGKCIVVRQGAAQLDLLPQPVGVLGKAPLILLQRRRLLQLLAQQPLTINDLQCPFRLGFQGRETLEVIFGRHPFATLPAFVLIDAQQRHHLRRVERPEGFEELLDVGSLAVTPQARQPPGGGLVGVAHGRPPIPLMVTIGPARMCPC
jgi:hypothetical protein